MNDAASVSPVDRAGLRQRVDKALTEFLANQRIWMAGVDDALAPLAEVIEAFVLGGGKRLRPAFAYWGYRGAGGVDSDQVLGALAALELVQASALIHDDLMDRSDTRRGEPAVHRRFAARHRRSGWGGDPDGFGDAAAILLGDLCLVWSDELLHSAGLEPRMVARARPVFDEMRTEVTVGQYLDVLAQVTRDTSVERAGKVARYKSAKYTVERPLLLGAALADAPADVEAAYSAYGLPLGEAFQLRDDVLGVFGDPAQTGKPAGDDLREGKRTYLVAAALEALDDADREQLRTGLGDPGLDEEGVARLRGLITRSGALARTEQRIGMLTDSALAALATVDLDSEARQALVDLAAAATRRTD
ncbi:polyprenyl synthetase family protein [Micromonospora avicenniae]|uniref:Geranylgeranyl diphosphate synthase, type I n=1 Tax=Micromonospora avicenniae TaxID=1198245 RepID=A0A1N6SLJ7_9ACTN|nr:polyprenyl synthetase family protein [Micromonospora avicenniae]SIQ41872.1 geranylgeranyl diphosphate synthase, type I [Micromonospora avicenniae]